MKSEPLLTIAIPTYNRKEYLKELLPIMLRQIQYADPTNCFIQLLIINNASTDGSDEIIGAIKDSRIKYIVNQTNLGADKNFIECIKHSSGKYVWLFGDDDLLEEGTVSKIIDLLRSDKFDLIIANDGNYATGLRGNTFFKSYSDLVEYVDSINPHFILAHTLITANIFRKNIFNIERAYQMLLSNYGHMYAMVDHLADGGAIYVSDDPMIVVREQRAHFASTPKNILLKQTQYLYYVGKKFNNSSIKIAAFYFLLSSYVKTLIYLPRRVARKVLNLSASVSRNWRM